MISKYKVTDFSRYSPFACGYSSRFIDDSMAGGNSAIAPLCRMLNHLILLYKSVYFIS